MNLPTYSTLFLDRDGIINERIIGGYVQTPEQLLVRPDFIAAMKIMHPLFKYVIVVTNQQGIGKKLMSENDLFAVHHYLQQQLFVHDIKIDAIYYCPHLRQHACACRKPQVGMIQQACRDFPDIDLSLSLVVGDSLSDIQLGQKAGTKTAFAGDDLPPDLKNQQPDYHVKTMTELAKILIAK
ncbi:MAG: HAD-IIIA family hydrolase [Bacteroidales bacterium]|nr:HAD-IIIA family hydrolase [Bacteroidales bacterium]